MTHNLHQDRMLAEPVNQNALQLVRVVMPLGMIMAVPRAVVVIMMTGGMIVGMSHAQSVTTTVVLIVGVGGILIKGGVSRKSILEAVHHEEVEPVTSTIGMNTAHPLAPEVMNAVAVRKSITHHMGKEAAEQVVDIHKVQNIAEASMTAKSDLRNAIGEQMRHAAPQQFQPVPVEVEVLMLTNQLG